MITSVREPEDITILVVDDEEDITEVVQHFLEEEGFKVETAYDGEEALEKASPNTDLILLDIMLPRLDGFQVCQQLRSRAETEHIPIIFFSAKVEDEDRVRGLMLGGDEYLTKPVTPQVIVAHVKAILRRSGVEKKRVLHVNGLKIYQDEFRASLEDQDLGLTLTEFELLQYLVKHPQKAYRRKQLLETIWKDAMMVTERTVDAHIKNLREKLGPFAVHIQTVRGIGYRYVQNADESYSESDEDADS